MTEEGKKTYRKDEMDRVLTKLEQGINDFLSSDKYMKYLKTMSHFPHYSLNNQILIATQNPDARLVAGMYTWNKVFGRSVKKGEKGIKIIAPMLSKVMREKPVMDSYTNARMRDKNGNEIKERTVVTVPVFRPVTVFDVSQTVGRDVPSLRSPDLMGSVEGYTKLFEAVSRVSGIPVRFTEIGHDIKGYFDNSKKEIVISDGMSQVQTMKTLVHETAHSILHSREKMEKENKFLSESEKETQAESIAYMVCAHFGIDTSGYSFPYVATWAGHTNTPEFVSSMNAIREATSMIIDKTEDGIEDIGRNEKAERLAGNVSELVLIAGKDILDETGPVDVDTIRTKILDGDAGKYISTISKKISGLDENDVMRKKAENVIAEMRGFDNDRQKSGDRENGSRTIVKESDERGER